MEAEVKNKPVENKAAIDMHRLLQDLAHFIALYEQTDDKLQKKQFETEQQIKSFATELDDHLKKINTAIAEISEVMSAAGAARWRVSAEEALSSGEKHTKLLGDLVSEFRVISEKCAVRLEKISIEAEKRIAKLLTTLAVEQEDIIEQFRKRAEENYKAINESANTAVTNLKKAQRWLSWERLGMTVAAALLGSFLTGIYINAEWPWESNKHATYERQIGRALLTVWPTLNSVQQDDIKRTIGVQNIAEKP